MHWVALVGPEIEENLSLRYLSSALQNAGFDTEIVPFNLGADLPRVLEQLLAYREAPLLVGLSLSFQWRATDFLALAVGLRERGFHGHITAGGHFASFTSEELLRDFPELDSVCRQEAEQTIVAVARALSEGKSLTGIPGVGHRSSDGTFLYAGHPALAPLEELAWPDRRGVAATSMGHGISPVLSSRGCYANCTFCCIAAWHEQTLPGKRYRLRAINDVADEMQWLQKERGVDVFMFHDDNFFQAGKRKNFERLSALADALEERHMNTYGVAVKARPTDVDQEVFDVLAKRLGCVRCYVGIETDADRGMKTLRRWASTKQNRKAIEVLRSLGLYASFNLLLFDPDTTIEDLEDNLEFLRDVPEFPFNFTRVELYAGTPLLARMQAEGRCWGDYLQWDYSLSSPVMDRAFELTMDLFEERNFGARPLPHMLMGNRFDVEISRRFHPELYQRSWTEETERLQRELTRDSVDVLSHIVEHVRSAPPNKDPELLERMQQKMQATDARLRVQALELARTINRTIGRGHTITECGDLVATPLQRGIAQVQP